MNLYHIYTDTTRLWFFFVFSSWIINEFFNKVDEAIVCT